jgi:uncharacterized protein
MVERRSWIPMGDGVRLAASLYLPEAVEAGDAAPVVLEALPYRKDDVTASYRAEYKRLCAEYGYAVARVDLRGTGSSEGVAADEYPASEQADLCRVIDWLASQSWSTGAVGMYGTSYSGFNSLQVAAERPSALKAVIAIYASDDRYTDDVHYTGGALKLLDLVDYPLYMVALNALPPVPAIAGPRWRERWRERVEDLEPWLLRWLQEQADGPYWRQGSLRPAYERIACPTMLVAGWADGYRNATFRVMERLKVPSRLLFGPWSHMAADTARPGPRIDLVPEMVRWRDEPTWPPERATTRTLPLSGAAAAGDGTDRPEVRGPAAGPTGWRCGRTWGARPGSAARATCRSGSRTTSARTTPGRSPTTGGWRRTWSSWAIRGSWSG